MQTDCEKEWVSADKPLVHRDTWYRLAHRERRKTSEVEDWTARLALCKRVASGVVQAASCKRRRRACSVRDARISLPSAWLREAPDESLGSRQRLASSAERRGGQGRRQGGQALRGGLQLQERCDGGGERREGFHQRRKWRERTPTTTTTTREHFQTETKPRRRTDQGARGRRRRRGRDETKRKN